MQSHKRATAKLIAVSILLASITIFSTTTSAQQATLHVYGPGGPLGPMKECAETFSKAKGVEVKVTAGPESQWIEQARQDADIIFGGAEYMLTQFTQKHPGIVDEKSRTELYIRAAGILVRKGNPKKIRSLADLARAGVKIVDVNGAGQLGLWEDLAGGRGLIPGIQKNIALSVETSADAIEKWKAMPELDAWITYESWHYRLKDMTDLVRLPAGERIHRGTPIAITSITKNRELAEQFIAFLKSDAGHAIFQKWGWK
ncbi:MAG TPA: substrate-binding domain-containing protein [Blastocatellia bacterium]|nr:substrate-binding domain-containing protein [Blastocatellia bacterium]